MCGIIGYTGPNDACPVLLSGLSQLEYRGYDSAGLAVRDQEGGIRILKKTGKVAGLEALCAAAPPRGTCGIGHPRWATHGGVTDENAHPHTYGRVTLIHNGIIENYHDLIERFDLQNLVSETDSEVAAAVFDHFYAQKKDPYEAIQHGVAQLTGSFAFCILFSDIPEKIFAIRNVSPMVASFTPEGSYIASDLTALIRYTDRYFIVPEYHILTMSPQEIRIQDLHGHRREPEWLTVTWTVESAQKGGYPHFMLKEIHEEPEALRRTISPRITDGLPDFSGDGVHDDIFRGCQKISIIACGTAMHAGMVAKTMIEPMMRIPVTVSIASEFRYEEPLVDESTLVIVISQSGETIDTLEALRLARRCHARTLAVVNVKGSTIARECDNVIYTHAGPEIAVASSKAYSVQLAALYLIGCKLGLVNAKLSVREARAFIRHLQEAIPAVEKVLENAEVIKKAAEETLLTATDAFYIGRGLDYTLAIEGALKIKEISYIHSEAYAAGELKHGTIALITEGVPVVAFSTQHRVMSKTLSNIREVKARGARVILLSRRRDITDAEVFDELIELPDLDDMFMVFPVAAVQQLLAYYTSAGRGLDVDKPRNLAKSVTVE